MTTQLSLLEAQTIGAPHNGTDTSIEAAQKVAPKVGTEKAIILHFLAVVDDATQPEMAEALGMLRSAVSGRVNALKNEGEIVETGELRMGPFGVRCKVYALKRNRVEVETGHPVGNASTGDGRSRPA